GIPLPVARVLRVRGLELGACGDLHALARRDLDLGTRLRVAARARSRGDLLESDPTGDRDLRALGDGLRDRGEEGVEHAGHCGLALTGRAGDARDEFGLGDGLVGHVMSSKAADPPPLFNADRMNVRPPAGRSTASNVSSNRGIT